MFIINDEVKLIVLLLNLNNNHVLNLSSNSIFKYILRKIRFHENGH